MTEHPNVALVRSGFEAMAAGDVESVMQMYSSDLKYYGWNAQAEQQAFTSRDEFFAMVFDAMSHCDEFAMDLVNAYAVGDSLVMAHIRAHRRARDSRRTLDDDFAMVFRIDDGVVTHGVDMIGPSFVEFWKEASSAS